MENEILYHYTDMNAFKGIVENQQVWMTDCRYCNDMHELETFWQNTVRHFHENKDQYHWVEKDWTHWCQEQINNYVFGIFCMSESPSVLSQWVRYASDGLGVCIGFEIPGGSRVKYEKVRYEDVAHSICDTRIMNLSKSKDIFAQNEDSARMLLARYLCKIKNDAFAEEREHRYIRTVPNKDANYRTSSSQLVPYIQCNPFGESPVPIKEVWLGPKTGESELRFVGAFLEKNGYDLMPQKYDCGYR